MGPSAVRAVRRILVVVSAALLSVVLVALLGLLALQTGWFKDWLRTTVVSQAALYLNGTLSIERLGGSILRGVELEGVALHHEGQTVVALGRLTLSYNPLTLIREGVVLDTLSLEHPVIRLERSDEGWNFNRFVKTREGGSGRGAPPISLRSIAIVDGTVSIHDRGRDVDQVTSLNGELSFAYSKPGIDLSIKEISGQSTRLTVKRLSGDLGFADGTIRVRDLEIDTDRSHVRAELDWPGERSNGPLRLDVEARNLSLPEAGRFFEPLAGIPLEPAVAIKATGTLGELRADIRIDSSTGTASGPLLVDLEGPERSIEGTLDVRNLNLAPILKNPARVTDITGRAQFDLALPTQSPRRALRVSFNFSGPEVEALGYRAQQVQASGSYEPGRLTLDARGAAYGATGTARGAFRMPASGPLTYSLEGRFRNVDLRRLPPTIRAPQLDTLLAGTYQFQVPGRGVWSGRAELADSLFEGASFASGTVVRAAGKGPSLTYAANGRVAQLNPRRIGEAFGIAWLAEDRFQGDVNGTFDVEGAGRSFDQLQLRADAALVQSDVMGARFPTLTAHLQIADRQLTSSFAGAFEDVPGSALTARPALADTRLSGTLDVGVAVAFPPEQPAELLQAGGRISLGPSQVAGITLNDARIEGIYADRVARITTLTATGPTIEATAEGTLALAGETQSDLIYDISASDLTPLATSLGRPIAGSIRLQGTVTGPGSRLTTTGEALASQLKYGDAVDVLAIKSRYTVEVPDMQFALASVDADTTATFVTLGRLELSSLSAQTRYEDQQLQFKTAFAQDRRSLGFDGVAVLHPDHQEVHLQALSVAVGQTAWGLPAGREAVVRYGSGVVVVENFELLRGEQHIVANGRVAVTDGVPGEGLRRSGENELDLRFERVQVRDLNEMLLGERPLEGVLDAVASISGTWDDPRASATFDLTAGKVQNVSFESLTGKADYRSASVDLNVRLQQSPTAVFEAFGRVPAPAFGGRAADQAPATIDLTIQSTPIDVGLLQALSAHVTNLTGSMQTNVHVSGTWEAPSLDGRIDIEQAAFQMTTTGVAYEGLNARLTFAGDRLLVDRFEIFDRDNDQLVALGELGISGNRLGALNLQVSAHQFEILANALGQVEFDADLRISGDARRPQIEGEMTSRPGRLEIDRLLELWIRDPYSTEATSATKVAGSVPAANVAEDGASSPSLYDAATVAVRVVLPDDMVLRGRDMQAGFAPIGLGDMNITIGGDLQIRKSPGGRPDVVGSVSVVRGFYEFQGRRFEVLRDSEIRFQGTQPIDPALRVSAQREISGVTALVQIRGTAREPQLLLSSSPPLDEADILSLIVFNQPINQLGESERLNLAERAGGLAAGYLTTPLANSIADALDLDLFEIRAVGEGTGQPTVALGQQFGGRLFVSFRQDFGSAEQSKLSLEYRISEFLRLVTSVAQGARRSHRTQRVESSGSDLIFVISY